MRSPEQAMPCFKSFNRTDFACGYACYCKTECEEQTDPDLSDLIGNAPVETDEIEPALDEQTQRTPDEEVAQEVARSMIIVRQDEKTASKLGKSKEIDPRSRFDIIDIPEEEKK